MRVIRRSDRTPARSGNPAGRLGLCLALVWALALVSAVHGGEVEQTPEAASEIEQQSFPTPEAASEALISAAERFDVEALTRILGPGGLDLVVTEDPVLDKSQSVAFAAQAREKLLIERDPDNPGVAVLVVGADEWPSPVPIVEESGMWRFDTEAGRDEVLYRRIGTNELDAIEVCRGYVEAQQEYALERHPGQRVNQYAQRIISSPGTRDGLAWVDAEGEWQGPVGEAIARAIEEGYETKSPFHGYIFKVLKGQGPAAPMGELDFVVGDAMIGGFALAAAPAEYLVTGVKTFIVSHDGVVYEQDLGPDTLERFRTMERYDPDDSWDPVAP